MKVALVHELLTMKGGAERVLKVFADMFPDAPIYTLLYNEEKLGEWFPTDRVIPASLPSPFSLLPSPLRYNHHLLLRHFPRMIESWDFFDYDLVISSSSAFAHGIITNGKPKHLCYVQSPARYLWDRTHDVLNRAGQGVLGPLRRRTLERTFHKLRTWDAEAADRPDTLVAASKEIQRRIELYWRRKSDVVYPPIDDFWFTRFSGSGSGSKEHKEPNPNTQPEPSYLIVSTLVHYKRMELAIEACNKGGKQLKIIGEGPARKDLEKRAGPTVEFLGFQPQEKVRELYTNAQATLFPGDEDFGLVPLESMACGTPVIAYRSGGALETIDEGMTGEFFSAPNADDLLSVMEKCETKMYDTQTCRMRAQQFSRERFEREIHKAIDTL